MSRDIAGTLRRADGSPLEGVSLVFRAVRTTDAGALDARPAESVYALGGTGEYSITLADGRYRVWLRWSRFERALGVIDVMPGAGIDLPNLLMESQL